MTSRAKEGPDRNTAGCFLCSALGMISDIICPVDTSSPLLTLMSGRSGGSMPYKLNEQLGHPQTNMFWVKLLQLPRQMLVHSVAHLDAAQEPTTVLYRHRVHSKLGIGESLRHAGRGLQVAGQRELLGAMTHTSRFTGRSTSTSWFPADSSRAPNNHKRARSPYKAGRHRSHKRTSR